MSLNDLVDKAADEVVCGEEIRMTYVTIEDIYNKVRDGEWSVARGLIEVYRQGLSDASLEAVLEREYDARRQS